MFVMVFAPNRWLRSDTIKIDPMGNKLFRCRYNAVISGVCGGLGKYFGIDALIFRFAFVALLLAGGSSIIIYLILLVVIPKEPLLQESAGTGSSSFNTFQQEDLAAEETDNSNKTIFGLLLISGGALMLLNNLVPLFNLKKLWPAILVIIGLGLLFQKPKPEDKSNSL